MLLLENFQPSPRLKAPHARRGISLRPRADDRAASEYSCKKSVYLAVFIPSVAYPTDSEKNCEYGAHGIKR